MTWTDIAIALIFMVVSFILGFATSRKSGNHWADTGLPCERDIGV